MDRRWPNGRRPQTVSRHLRPQPAGLHLQTAQRSPPATTQSRSPPPNTMMPGKLVSVLQGTVGTLCQDTRLTRPGPAKWQVAQHLIKTPSILMTRNSSCCLIIYSSIQWRLYVIPIISIISRDMRAFKNVQILWRNTVIMLRQGYRPLVLTACRT